MDNKHLQKSLDESTDIESIIQSLSQLGLESDIDYQATSVLVNHNNGISIAQSSNVTKSNTTGEWTEVLLKEMQNASSIEDAKARASRVLEVFDKSIRVETAYHVNKEIVTLKKQMVAQNEINCVLKRAVIIQHQRQQENEKKDEELQYVKQLCKYYEEKVKNTEIDNLRLALALRQENRSMPINRDVY